MAIPFYHLRCLEKRLIALATYELRLEKPAGMTFKPGQFVLFDVPSLTDPGDVQPRAFSIASHPDESDLCFCIKLKEGGRASLWLEKALKVGDTVTVKGPFGNFVLHEHDAAPLLFLCTGAGVAPFRSMIMDRLRRASDSVIDLVFGVRKEEELFWVDDFSRLAAAHPSLRVHVALSRPSPMWSGLTGRIQQVAPGVVPDYKDRIVYVCGNPDMTTEVKKLCLEAWGIPKERLHVEGYI